MVKQTHKEDDCRYQDCERNHVIYGYSRHAFLLLGSKRQPNLVIAVFVGSNARGGRVAHEEGALPLAILP
jgi:hypothetical protein